MTSTNSGMNVAELTYRSCQPSSVASPSFPINPSRFSLMALNVGSVNAVLNVTLWLVHTSLSFLAERTYARLASRQLRRNGETDATDSGEVHASNWLFRWGSGYHKHTKRVAWWSLLLMVLLSLVLPSELVFETGIFERKDCTPVTHVSSGICASPWHGHGNVFVSSTSLLTACSTWVDDKWEILLEGSRKKPRPNEVRKVSALKAGRRVVLASCNVHTFPCPSASACGNLTIWNSEGTYGTIVRSSSLHNATGGKFSFGDVTFDGSMGLAFMFWEGRNQQRVGLRKPLFVSGIETVLNEDESLRIVTGKSKTWNLATAPSRTRLYNIQCDSDGLRAEDLTRAVGVYRGMQMEQPGVRRDDVKYNISRVMPVSSTDVLKSGFALKSEDGSDTCTGEIDVYVQCGDFKAMRLLPFILSATLLGLVWIIVKMYVPEGEDKIPVDGPSWRLIAHNQALALMYLLESDRRKLSTEKSGDGKQGEAGHSAMNEADYVSLYSHEKFELQIRDPCSLKRLTAKMKDVV